MQVPFLACGDPHIDNTHCELTKAGCRYVSSYLYHGKEAQAKGLYVRGTAPTTDATIPKKQTRKKNEPYGAM